MKPEIFPQDLLILLKNHFKNPKASTDSDFNLVIELNKFDPKTEKNYIFELDLGQFLKYRMGENLFWVQREKKGLNVRKYRLKENTFLVPMPE